MIIASANDITISDHIVACQDIPLMGCRNRDRTPIIGEFTMTVSENCPSEHRAVGNQIDVYMSEPIAGAYYNPEFVGNIVKADKAERGRDYKVVVRSILAKLQDKILSYVNLRYDLSAGLNNSTLGKYWDDDYSSNVSTAAWPSMRIDWIIEVMFTQIFEGTNINFAFDAGFEDKKLETINQYPSPPPYDRRIMLMKHLRMDENMFYAINQPFAAGWIRTIQPDNSNNRITYFDFISACCSYLNLKLEFSTEQTTSRTIIMKYITDDDGFVISGNLIFDKTNKTYEAQNDGYNYNLQFNERSSGAHWARSLYQSITTEWTLSNHSGKESEGKGTVSLYTNFLFLYEVWWSENPPECFLIESPRYPGQFYGGDDISVNKGNVQSAQYIQTTFKTDLTFQSNARQNILNVKQRELKIIYESIG